MAGIIQDLYFCRIGRNNKERDRETCNLYTASIELELSYLDLAMATHTTYVGMCAEVQPGLDPLAGPVL